MSRAGMIGNWRPGGDDPERGQEAVEFVERWQRERRERRAKYWLRRLMAPPPTDNHENKEQQP